MAISFGSIGTGLPKDIVQQIIQAERKPIEKMEKRKAQYASKKALLGELQKYVSDLKGGALANRTPRSFRELAVLSGDNDLVDIFVDKNKANPGSWQFEVTRLAQKSSLFTNGVESPDETYVGVGYIGYELPNGDEKEIYIDSDNSSLNGMAKLINADRTNGMNATVVNDGIDPETPWRLIVSLEDSGDINKAVFPYFYLVDGQEDLYVDQERQGHDAKIKLDGFEIEVPENTAKDIIPGLAIDLLKADPGKEFTIEIGADVEKIADKVKSIIETINKILSFIKQQNTLDENSDTRSTLGGDLTLQTLESRLRGTLFKYVETSMGSMRPGDIGITFQRSGLIEFDGDKFEAQLKKDYKSTAEVLVGRISSEGQVKGLLHHLGDLADGAVAQPYGFITTRSKGVDRTIRDIDNRIANKEKFLKTKEQALKNKFARLEETVSQLKSQGAGLAGMGAGTTTQLG